MKQFIAHLFRTLGYAVVRQSTLAGLQSRIVELEGEQRVHAASEAVDYDAIDRAEYTRATLDITERQFQTILPMLAERQGEVLRIPFVRDYLGARRYRYLTDGRKVEYAAYHDGDVIKNTVQYNQDALDHVFSLDRIRITLNVVTSISELGRNLQDLKILLLGPRSETELYAVQAAGFSMANVSALDLLTYSPLVTPGDMHAMPFADNSFDVVFITCVWSYSNNIQKAVAEVKRVLRDGGYVAFVEGMHYDFLPEEAKADLPPAYDKDALEVKSKAWWGCVDDVLKLFGDSVVSVPFRSDPTPPYDGWGLLVSTVFKIRK